MGLRRPAGSLAYSHPTKRSAGGPSDVTSFGGTIRSSRSPCALPDRVGTRGQALLQEYLEIADLKVSNLQECLESIGWKVSQVAHSQKMTDGARSERLRDAVEAVEALRVSLDVWSTAAALDSALTDPDVEAVGVLREAFNAVLRWIECAPDRCQEMGIWWGGTSLHSLAVPLPDLIELAHREAQGGAPELLRAMYRLRWRRWLTVDTEWRLSLRLRTSP